MDTTSRRVYRRSRYARLLIKVSLIAILIGISLSILAEKDAIIGSGLEYQRIWITDMPWSIHVLKVDRTRNDIEIRSVIAKGKVLGLDTLSSQVNSISTSSAKPLAAINGDFFIREGLYKGDMLGISVVDGEIVSEPNGPSFWIDNEGTPRLDVVGSDIIATFPNGEKFSIGLNRERKDTEAVLYTPKFGCSTWWITDNGTELVLKEVESGSASFQIGGTYVCQVIGISKSGNVELRPDVMVLSVGSKLLEKMGEIKVGDIVKISVRTIPDLSNARVAVGGGPVLARGGKANKFDQEARHPRTAIGWNDKHVFIVVVDGRQPQLSIGMFLNELAEFMVQLGCSEAINLDGGGSSTFWLNGSILNSPSDGKEREIANSIVLLRKISK